MAPWKKKKGKDQSTIAKQWEVVLINLLFKLDTDVEKQGRDWCVAANVDHAESIGELTFSGSDKKQPGDKCKSLTVQTRTG